MYPNHKKTFRCVSIHFQFAVQKTREGDEGNKPLLSQINYVLLHLHLAGKYDAKPTSEELNDWLHSEQLLLLP
jgi:hypothetical protein